MDFQMKITTYLDKESVRNLDNKIKLVVNGIIPTKLKVIEILLLLL